MITSATLVAALVGVDIVTAYSLCKSLSRPKPSRGKAGLGWGNNGAQNMDQFLSAKVPWYYNWNFQVSDDASGLPVEFVPMLWGQAQADEFSDTIVSTLQSTNATAILGMNEPQETGQSNLTPEQAVELWKQYLEPLRAAHNVRLGSPAPSGAPGSWQWLTAFLQQCGEECTVDFLVLHWYGTNATAFKEFLVDYHSRFNMNIWVTEWACQNMAGPGDQCSMSDVFRFMQETQAFMDNTDWIERYAWYGSKTPDAMHGVNLKNAMMNSSGIINGLGTQYIGLSAAPALPPVFTNDRR
ncbi:hypothetical protein R3P38DRAFT_2543365 [Favolaschia claudopus]|uniref:Asl1-like glycosyl hydrolase catalytic domain-containing protein n=1 Tax=Favolaschia claudopus TaxID=2862362 RepID=A0AAW0AR82_9AGAR